MGKKKNRQEQVEPIQVSATPQKPAINLSGVHVLFVGGRHQQGVEFGKIVENLGGTYAYHDGGMNENLARLDGLVNRASVIIVAVDNISHDGAARIKKLSKQRQLPVVYLPHCGAGAFGQALERIAVQPDTTAEHQPSARKQGCSVTTHAKGRMPVPV